MNEFVPRSVARVAVLGLGSIGLRHARNVRELGLGAIGFDPCAEARAIAEAHGTSPVGSAEEAISLADIVVIASPSGRHLDYLELCIAARRPALVEKPMGHDPARAAALLDAAEAVGLPIGAVFNLRWRSVVEALRATLAERVGPPVWTRFVSASWLPDWRPGNDYRAGYANDPVSGGVVFDVIHELDLACHLIGPAEVVSSVLRHSGRLDIVTEDTAEIVLEHTNGCLSSLHLDFASPVRRRAVEICGLDGIAYADLRKGEIGWFGRDGEPVATTTVAIDPGAEYRLVLADFVGALVNGARLACDGRAGLAALQLAARARALGAGRAGGARQ